MKRQSFARVPLDLSWNGKYIRLWLDAKRTKYVEGIVEPGTALSQRGRVFLRVPGERGKYSLSQDRDLEEIQPSPELIAALGGDQQRGWEDAAAQQYPKTMLCLHEVRAAVRALRTETNSEAIDQVWTTLQRLVQAEAQEVEDSVHAVYRAKLAHINTKITTVGDYLRRSE